MIALFWPTVRDTLITDNQLTNITVHTALGTACNFVVLRVYDVLCYSFGLDLSLLLLCEVLIYLTSSAGP